MNENNSSLLAASPTLSKSFKSRKLVTYLLNLNLGYDKIYSSYSTQTKRNLKNALFSSLTISRNVSPIEVITLFKENRGKKYNFSASYYTLLENLMKSIIEKGFGQSTGVFDKSNKLCAGAFFLEGFNRSIFLFSGTNKTAFETSAMTLLINNYIKEKSEIRQLSDGTLFDFEGSMDANLARFYSGFGSQKVEFLQIRRNSLPIPFRWVKEMQIRRKTNSEI